MRKSITLIALAAALPVALLGGGQAGAATAVAGEVTGAGTIAPGLTAVPTAQTFSFAGTIAAGVGAGTAIAAHGADLAGSVAEGAGTVTITAPATCAGVFVRVGAVVVAATAGTKPCAAAGVFAFIPDQIGAPAPAGTTTVTSYRLIGAGAGAF